MKMLFKSLRPVLSAMNTFREDGLRCVGESPDNKRKEVEQASLVKRFQDRYLL